MEFLRFGSRIPGIYWGCCAVCIIQDFKQDPKAPAAVQLLIGDSGSALPPEKGYMGPTWEDIFRERLRIGTFGSQDMPNHVFFAVLTKQQISTPGSFGAKWLKILKEEGFEFVRTTDNSVYTSKTAPSAEAPAHENYIFALYRNISGNRVKNPFMPPKEWLDLPTVVPEAYTMAKPELWEQMAADQTKAHLKLWTDHGKTKFLSKAEAEKLPLMIAGKIGGAQAKMQQPTTTAKTKAA